MTAVTSTDETAAAPAGAQAAPAGPARRLRVQQIRSGIGGRQNQRDTLRTLGLGRIGAVSVKQDRPEIRGMVRVVAHLVTVEEVD